MTGFIRLRFQIGFIWDTLEAAPTHYPKADEIYFCLESAILYLVIYVDVNKKKYYTVQNSNNTSGGRGEILF